MPRPGRAPIHLEPWEKEVGKMHSAWEQWFQNVQQQFNTFRSPTQPTVGASPFIYQFLGTSATQQGPVQAHISGTVSLVELSRDGVVYFTVASTAPTLVPLSVGDFLRITYPGAAPVLTVIPQ